MHKLIKALQHGECLENPEYWKKMQMLVTAIVPCISALSIITGHELSEQSISAIAWANVLILGAVNSYLIPATSTKVGYKGKK